jgi:hypothetical protein
VSTIAVIFCKADLGKEQLLSRCQGKCIVLRIEMGRIYEERVGEVDDSTSSSN